MSPKTPPPLPSVEPLARLTEDTLKHMDDMKAELDKAKSDLDALEVLGLDTSRLREKINWGYQAREVILKTFGEEGPAPGVK